MGGPGGLGVPPEPGVGRRQVHRATTVVQWIRLDDYGSGNAHP
ncbi:hypothetical protein [Streptomyces sp. NPDC017448]